MNFEHNGHKIALLGDTHLGRVFTNNVPLARRGEREKSLMEKFKHELQSVSEDVDYHIHMGDLFDLPVVDYSYILTAAMVYLDVSSKRPDTQFYILEGNHDASRDLIVTTAFDLFTACVGHQPNITVVRRPLHIPAIKTILLPWSPLASAQDQVETLTQCQADLAFGHWDVDPRSHEYNMIPLSRMREKFGVKTAYTGHVHLPDKFRRDGVDVVVVGSMIPFAHDQDPTGDIYVTLTLAEFVDTDKATLRDKCVRIELAPGEVFDEQVDCLQLSFKRPQNVVSVEETVDFDAFDMRKLFTDLVEEYEVPEKIRKQLEDRWLASGE